MESKGGYDKGISSPVIPTEKKLKKESGSKISHVQLSSAIRVFFDQKLSKYSDVYAGEQLHGCFAALPIVVKLFDKNERNKREARILAKLNHHSNVISLIEAGFYASSLQNYIYIAVDRCHQENLREFVQNQQENEILLEKRLEIVKQLITGVEYIHSKNIVHLDLKPDNILFTLDQKTVKIADFDFSEEISCKKMFVKYQFGSSGFRPPESFGNSYVSLKTDIFSLGVVFFFVMSNGINPFGEDLDIQNVNIKNGKSDLSCLLVPNLETTKHLLKYMIDTKPENRPTIQEVSEHPCWTGKEVICDFDFRTSEDSESEDEQDPLPYSVKDLSSFIALLEKHRKTNVRPDAAYGVPAPEVHLSLHKVEGDDETSAIKLYRGGRIEHTIEASQSEDISLSGLEAGRVYHFNLRARHRDDHKIEKRALRFSTGSDAQRNYAVILPGGICQYLASQELDIDITSEPSSE